ncbi:MAG: NAD(P) transhydrogenase subunit alpha [Alkalispirochaeta sp.]
MNIVVVKETAPDEPRVALVPGDVPGLTKTGATVLVEAGAGDAAGFTDGEYTEKGAKIVGREEALQQADVLCAVRLAAAADPDRGGAVVDQLPEGAAVVALMNPYGPHPDFAVMATRKQRAFALERIPRITRAQSMDVLSSQANIAGYRAVLLGATALPKLFPMMMTAAGTVVPARVFVVGVGVAGLQAIATAKRLGAVVSAYDIRPAVKEQVHSLGARFVEIEVDSGDTETSGGYAREMDEEFYRKQREKMLEVVAETDVVITTAAIPGKKAPILVTTEMVEAMAPGTVVVDVAAERGGNCELTRAGETVEHGGVRILGPVNLAAGAAHHAAQLFSRNVATFLKELIDDSGNLAVDTEDEIVAATLIIDESSGRGAELAGTEEQP